MMRSVPAIRMSMNEALVANDVDDGRQYVVRWAGNPTVLARGPIAVMWGEYESLINGQVSHCGIDWGDPAELDGEWKIVNWMWTAGREKCRTGPRDAGIFRQ